MSLKRKGKVGTVKSAVSNPKLKKETGKHKKHLKDPIEVDPVIDLTGSAEKETIRSSAIEDILFKLPVVASPLIGTPKQVQEELDTLVKSIQKKPHSKAGREAFNKIHLYMHGYLINIVLKQFPYIKGMQTVDIYQQTLIALWSKAIPGFKTGMGMSFLNFAKMCIRRHLITILNTSKTRQKDQSINRAISLDSPVNSGDEESNNTYSNTVADDRPSTDKLTEKEEAYRITKCSLLDVLSDFEKIVLDEYLSTSTYREIAKNIRKKTNKRCLTKSVDNALLRIRKKAIHLKKHSKSDDVPLFIL